MQLLPEFLKASEVYCIFFPLPAHPTIEVIKMDMFHNSGAITSFSMALSQSVNASEHSTGLTEAEKEELINRAKDSESEEEVTKIIAELTERDGIS